ncbi:hypothetical protein HanPSC8_Chr14g0626131 [Helianthus annuus]|nr:hypothetical protein HanPSC8_Chr14g0626131 [Helianthus annuus]
MGSGFGSNLIRNLWGFGSNLIRNSWVWVWYKRFRVSFSRTRLAKRFVFGSNPTGSRRRICWYVCMFKFNRYCKKLFKKVNYISGQVLILI